MFSPKMFVVIAVAVLFAAHADAAAHGGSVDFAVDVERVSEFFLPTSVGGSPELDGEQITTVLPRAMSLALRKLLRSMVHSLHMRCQSPMNGSALRYIIYIVTITHRHDHDVMSRCQQSKSITTQRLDAAEATLRSKD